jgi:hypothetical protein
MGVAVKPALGPEASRAFDKTARFQHTDAATADVRRRPKVEGSFDKSARRKQNAKVERGVWAWPVDR